MNKQDYTLSITVNATAQETFNSINNVEAWWTTDFEGRLNNINDIFTVRFGEVFITMKVLELMVNEKIVWLVIDCNKPWLKNTKEWTGTKLNWEILEENNKTQINFTHIGLIPNIECFDVCANAWSDYLQNSLLNFINTSKGLPTLKN
jgi:hypothetical protein